jgi:hypothetical protein
METAMVHYHIRWSGSKIDWEVFSTEEEAQIEAAKLVRPGESYTIDKFEQECPRCRTRLIPKTQFD